MFEITLTTSTAGGKTDPQKYGAAASGNVTLTADFDGPGAEDYTGVVGFWDGDNVWKIRFMPTVAGSWTYTITSNDTDLNAVGNDDGFTAVAPTTAEKTANPNLRGLLQIDSSNRKLEYADGTPFPIISNTFWTGNCTKCPYGPGGTADMDDWKTAIDTTASLDFNAINIWAGVPNVGTGDWAAEVQRNEGGWGFVNETINGNADWDEINVDKYKYFDPRIRYIIDKGMVPVIWFSWAYAYCDDYNTNPDFTNAEFQAYYKYLLARYQGYNVIFNTVGEYNIVNLEPSNCEGATDIADMKTNSAAFDTLDKLNHITIIHPWHTGVAASTRDDFENESWHDMASIQTKISPQQTHDEVATVVKTVYDDTTPTTMPTWVSEIAYENDNTQYDRVRQGNWAAMFSGAAGFATGQRGIWDCNNDGWRDPNARFDDALNFTGFNQIPHLVDFINTVSWVDMTPDNSLSTTGHTMANVGEEYAVYHTAGSAGFNVTLIGERYYSYKWFDPTDGSWTSSTVFYHAGAGPSTKSFQTGMDEWALFISKACYPDPPSITNPTNLDIDVATNVTFTSSAYSIESGCSETHTGSDWEVATDSGFTNVVAASYDDTSNKESIAMASMTTGLTVLGNATTYHVRVRHYNSVDDSDYSSGVSFTTIGPPGEGGGGVIGLDPSGSGSVTISPSGTGSATIIP
jgi:hypothetical protein